MAPRMSAQSSYNMLHCLRRIFDDLKAKGNHILPDILLDPDLEYTINTNDLIIAFLHFSVSCDSMANDLSGVFRRHGFFIMGEPIPSIVELVRMNRELQKAIHSWARFWCLNFLFPMMDRSERKHLVSTYSTLIERAKKRAIRRDSDRCPVTRVTDIKSPGTLVAVNIIPPRVQQYSIAQHLASIFTGHRFILESPGVPSVEAQARLLDSPENLVTLSQAITPGFENYHWGLSGRHVPDQHHAGYTTTSYILEPVHLTQVHQIERLPNPHLVMFGGRDRFSDDPAPRPFPPLLELHRALCHVLYRSSAGDPILAYQAEEELVAKEAEGLLWEKPAGRALAAKYDFLCGRLLRKLGWAANPIDLLEDEWARQVGVEKWRPEVAEMPEDMPEDVEDADKEVEEGWLKVY
ncbi:hypothetical protein FQN50_008504 [Emmonsiellopsis sp. PD_5]|nr:hypothetical protein FQN50_008504 [Emmonsiellopsis sp. PD_5]